MLITLICIVVIDLETDQSEASSTKAGGEEVGSRVIPNWSPPDERVAAFTDYSISSSVVPRNKGEERERERERDRWYPGEPLNKGHYMGPTICRL